MDPKFKDLIELHRKWRNGEEGGIRANLSGANLIRVDLIRADLSGANLSGANLIRVDLSGANLSGANLSGANLSGANLSGADLSGANLSGANLSGANLSGANLSGANLRGANLSGADLSGANLSEANLTEALLDWDPIPALEHIDAQIFEAITSPEQSLDMSNWHTCQTTHCWAGWTIVLAGQAGQALEQKYGTNPAAALIYAKSRPGIRVPNWFDSNEVALEKIRRSVSQTLSGEQ